MMPGVNRDFLDDVTRQTWSLFLGIPLTELAAPAAPAECAALVMIDGAWRGALVVSCSQALARRAAATLYSLPVANIDERRWQDTLNEVANIIGGNLKALLPAPSRLGLPTALGGWFPDAASTIAYHSDQGELYVTLLDADGALAAASTTPGHDDPRRGGRRT